MPRINPRKLTKLTHVWHARSKTSDSSSNFGKTIRMEMVAQEGEGLFKVSEGGNHRINHSQPALAP